MRVLLAEDDPRLSDVLVQGLTEAGWDVEAVGDGLEAYGRAVSGAAPDVLLLDWMLPGMDGLTLCRRLRDMGVTTPVLVLTARGAVRDRIHGLDAGADDYVPKPFDLDELLARLRALVRRATYDEQDVVTVGDLVVDGGARLVRRGGTDIDLSAREFDILWLLATRVGKVVSRYTILDEVWDGETDLRSNVIDVHLGAIRAKVDKPFGTSSITTVRGAGYRLEVTRRSASGSAPCRCGSGWSPGSPRRCSCSSPPPVRSSTGVCSTPSTAGWTPSSLPPGRSSRRWSEPTGRSRPRMPRTRPAPAGRC
jgi:two-component system OmpR family response regulator